MGIPIIATFAALLALAGCNFRIDKSDGSLQSEETWFQKIQRETLSPKCVRCHSGELAKKGIRLDSYFELINARTPGELPLIRPGDLAGSALVAILRDAKMPPSGPLANSEISAIEKWILSGAREDAPHPQATQTPSPIPEPEPEPIVTPDPVKPDPTFSYLSKAIFSERCTTCHSGEKPKAGIDLSSYQKLMESDVVVAGDPDSSSLYLIVAQGAMPPRPPKLANETIDLIHNWILNGAEDN